MKTYLFIALLGFIVLLSYFLGLQYSPYHGQKIVCAGGDDPVFCNKYLFEEDDKVYYESDFTGNVYYYKKGAVYIRIN